MLVWIDNCVGCTDMGLHCLGESCPNKGRYVEVCNICEEELDEYGNCPICDREDEDEDEEED